MKMQSQKIIEMKNGNIITAEELIIASVSSLKKWENVIEKGNYGEKCGFCHLLLEKNISIIPLDLTDEIPEHSCIHQCPAGKICNENITFWSEIDMNPKKQIAPIEFKYQAKRIQKNIDWIKAYLKEIQEW